MELWPTFTVAGVGQRRLVGDVLAPTQQVVLDDWSLVLQLTPESAVIILKWTIDR
jgi:hypothetical protein